MTLSERGPSRKFEKGAGLKSNRVGQAPFELLDRRLLQFPAAQVSGEVIYVHDDREGARRKVGAEVPGTLEQEVDRAVVAVHDVVHEVPSNAKLRLEAYPLLAELGLQSARGPVQDDHVIGTQRATRKVYPEVARRRASADGGPEKLRLLDPPPLDGHREEAVRQAGIAVATFAAGLLDAGALRGPQLVRFEDGDQGLRSTAVFGARRVAAGDEASDRVLDHHGASQEVRDPAGQLRHGGLAADALEQGPRCPVGVAQERYSLGVSGEEREELAQRHTWRDGEETQTELFGVLHRLLRRLALRAPDDCGRASFRDGGEEPGIELIAAGHNHLVEPEPTLRILVQRQSLDGTPRVPQRKTVAAVPLGEGVEQLFKDHPSPNPARRSLRRARNLIIYDGRRTGNPQKPA